MSRGKDGGRREGVGERRTCLGYLADRGQVLGGKVMILDATPSRTIEDLRQEACSKMKKDVVERCGQREWSFRKV